MLAYIHTANAVHKCKNACINASAAAHSSHAITVKYTAAVEVYEADGGLAE